MGGCAMGPDERTGVVDEDGRHYHLRNLSVHDGSVFPTSIAANPQLSIYASRRVRRPPREDPFAELGG